VAAIQTKEAARVLEKPPSPELADIFRRFGKSYRKDNRIPLHHLKVMRAIEYCRTSELGGHMKVCDTCGYSHPAYNSLRKPPLPQVRKSGQGKVG